MYKYIKKNILNKPIGEEGQPQTNKKKKKGTI
jgi:hypothetical protein